MARIRSVQPLLPSLLDRLLDDAPDTAVEPAKPVGVALQDIKANIRRDLEWILNTRSVRPERADAYSELQCSLVTYGLPDFSAVLLGSEAHREEFRLSIQAAIERLEPRLQRLQVAFRQTSHEERTLYLRISALLLIEPDPIPLLFDSRIRHVDKTLRLRDASRG